MAKNVMHFPAFEFCFEFFCTNHFQSGDEKSAVEKRYTQWLRHVNLSRNI